MPVFEKTFETPYGKTVTLRRANFSKKGWAHLCSKFGVTEWAPSRVVSIHIEGQTDYDRLTITAVVEKETADVEDDMIW